MYRVEMANWQHALPTPLSRLIRPRFDNATPLADIRRYYDSLSAAFGEPPADMVAERAQLGQIKGQWVSVGETQPQRLILYFHGGGYISGSLESHRGLVARLDEDHGFPPTQSAAELGAIDDVDVTYDAALAMAETLAAAGCNLNFAPVVDLNVNPGNPVIGGST